MHEITAHAPRPGPSTGPGTGRWAREWWLWPLALLTLGWALMLGAYAWNREDELRERSRLDAARDLGEAPAGKGAAAARPIPLHGRVLVEHALVLRHAAGGGNSAGTAFGTTLGTTLGTTRGTTQWLFPVVDAGWREGRTVKDVLRVPEGAPLRALSHAPRGPWLVTPRGAASATLIEALRAKGLEVDASTALVQWHSIPVEP